MGIERSGWNNIEKGKVSRISDIQRFIDERHVIQEVETKRAKHKKGKRKFLNKNNKTSTILSIYDEQVDNKGENPTIP